MGTLPQDVRNMLTTLAFGKEIMEEFSQGERLKGASVEGVNEGYCRGVCLDWARRVLQLGNITFSRDVVDSEGGLSR